MDPSPLSPPPSPAELTTSVYAYMNLTINQRAAIQAAERVGASLSLIGVLVIFIAYGAFKRLRNVPNTFIMFASIANVGACVACLIGYSGVDAGRWNALCQIQAFLLEMFMQSDPWWSFAMAINVYMVFFLAANPNQFRRYLWIYCTVCFGAPAIPAIVCLAIRTDRGPIYGNATLWCWIGDEYNQLRIFTYYIPIWVCILLSAVIYIAVGYHVFHQRNQLRNLTLSNPAKDLSCSDLRDSAEKTQQPTYYGTVTTEVQVKVSNEAPEMLTPPPTPTPSMPPTHQFPIITVASQSADCRQAWAPASVMTDMNRTRSPTATTPIPTTLPFATISSVSSARVRAKSSRSRALSSFNSRLAYKLRRLDPVKLAYLRTSFVFAISVLVTWTPSSINRVYNLIYPDDLSFGLNMASAVVLPLQGVWNCFIFCATGWAVLREEVRSTVSRHSWLRKGAERLNGTGDWIWGPSSSGGHAGERYGKRPTAGETREIELSLRLGTMRVARGESF